MTEIDIASDPEHAERGSTAATDLQLESEQRAMQAPYDRQNAARTAREADGQSVPLPSFPYLQAFFVCNDRHLLHHQLICLWTCKCNQLNGLRRK